MTTIAPADMPWLDRLEEFLEKVLSEQVPPDPEIDKIVSDNIWDLYNNDVDTTPWPKILMA